MPKQIKKPFDILEGSNPMTCHEVDDYGIFCFKSEHEDLGEDCPLYIKIPRNKYVRLGHPVPHNCAANKNKCFLVIPR